MSRIKGTTKDKGAKRKAVPVRICPREHGGKVTEPYQILEAIIEKERSDLADVHIAIAWHVKGWRPDADGVRTLGKAIKHGEVTRAQNGLDWTIYLSEPVWKALDDDQKYRMIWHELRHIGICYDKDSSPMLDDKDRIVTRVRRHDVQGFRDEITRFGLPEGLTDAQMNDADRGLLKLAEAKDEETELPGGDSCLVTRGSKNSTGPQITGHGPRITGDGPSPIRIKFKGLKKVSCTLFPARGVDGCGWRCGYGIQFGNAEDIVAIKDCQPYPTKELAILAATGAIRYFLGTLPATGTADQKRAMARRNETAREQIAEQLKPYLEDRPSDLEEKTASGRTTRNEIRDTGQEVPDGPIPFEED